MSEEFNEKLNETKESEEAVQQANDNKHLKAIIEGRQIVTINGKDVIFDFPTTEVALHGDMLAAQFRSLHLRKGDILTEDALKVIYNQPIFITVDGKEVKIGDGSWPEKIENEFNTIPKKIRDAEEIFNLYREDYQRKQAEREAAKGKAKKEQIDKEIEEIKKEAHFAYQKLIELRARQLELYAERTRLFADSLEEQTFLEKVKYFAPSCIKKIEDGEEVPFWKSEEEMFKGTLTTTKIIGMFNLFLRGLSLDFFGDAPEEKIS